jgi:trk system potassium uptake protein TrkA
MPFHGVIITCLLTIVHERGSREDFVVIHYAMHLFFFVIRGEDAGPVENLPLPKRCAVICVYRYDEMILPSADFHQEADDEVVLLAHEDSLREVRERWAVIPAGANGAESGG